MAKELSDEELNLKIKARRRLIGAVALTLAVVVVLPMVLESEPKSSGQDIELRIPSPEDVPPLIPAMPAPEPEPIVEPAASDVAVAPISPAPVMVAAPEKPAIEPSALPKPAASPAPVEKPVVSTENVAAGVSYVLQVGAYSNTSTAKKQYAQLKSWGFKVYTEKSGNTTRVRVGPYAERDKVDKVAKLLENHGLKPSVVTLK